jgi:hypothetical protein
LDIQNTNKNIYQKLSEIDKSSQQTFLKSTKPVILFKRNKNDSQIKNEIRTLAQENLFMLKKLITQESEYKHDKLEKFYLDTRKYKKNLCRFPVIDFNNTKSPTKSIVQGYKFSNKNSKMGKLPKLGDTKKKINLTTIHTRYTHNSNELDRRYFKEVKQSAKIKTVNKSSTSAKDKKSMNIVTENDEDDASSFNKKSVRDSGSNGGSGYEDKEDNKSRSCSASGSEGSD